MNDKINTISDIEHIFYINLEHRTDRKEHAENQLKNIFAKKPKKWNATKMENGAIGCSISHLKLLKYAITQNLPHILVCEDDILFTNPSLFTKQLNTFFEKQQNDWDVLLLAGNNIPPYTVIDESFVKVRNCQTTTAYLVNSHYFKKLYDNISEGVNNLLKQPQKKSYYAIDRFWFNLQEKDKWFLITPLTVVQRPDYSDIEKKYTDYKYLMLDLDKVELMNQIKKQQNTYALEDLR